MQEMTTLLDNDQFDGEEIAASTVLSVRERAKICCSIRAH